MSHSLLHSSIKQKYPPNADGYVRVRLSDGQVVEEHRVLMSRALGRDLHHWEIVRHLNGDRADNALSNLMLDQHGEAGQAEQTARRVCLCCANCGKTFSRRACEVALSRRRGQTRFFCGHGCVGKSFGRAKTHVV